MRYVAECIFVLMQPAVGRDVDPPARDILAFMVSWSEPQHLADARRRCLIMVAGHERDADGQGKRPSSDQILLADGDTQAVVVRDELADEFMQPGLKDFLHPAVLNTGAHGAGLALGRSLPAICARDMIEIEHEILVAACERARQLIAQDEQVRYEPRLDALTVDPMIGGERRDRP